MKRARVAAPLVLLVGMAAGSVTMAGSAPAAPTAPLHITIANYAFTPASATVVAGQTVVWTNEDKASHNATTTSAPAAFVGATLPRGQSWQWIAGVPGVYRYICSVHPDMHGELVVRPAPTPTAEAATHSAARSTPRHRAPATRAAAAPSTLASASPAASTRAAVDPTLLIVGIAVGATVFCLLVLASHRRSA